jgi:ATP-dependent helicase/DNAse subunit B
LTVRILLAPAASGKTTYILEQAQLASGNLQSAPLIIVQTDAQKFALRNRLAKAGGAMGIRIETFSVFSKQSLSAVGENYTTLTKPIQHQLLRHVVNRLPLVHYRPLVGKPGFIQELARIIHDLKAAKIWPKDFLRAVDKSESLPRLHELGLIYEAYQSYLIRLKWADDSGWAWLAVEALEKSAGDITSTWSLLIVDGFDNFTEVLLAMLEILASSIEETIITLTSVAESQDDKFHRPNFQRFQTTKEKLEAKFGVKSERLRRETPVLFQVGASRSPVLSHLERYLFADTQNCLDAGDAVALTAAPDRSTEVRTALRWLKERIVLDSMRPQEIALLARSLTPYDPFIRQIAAEFGLPIHLAGKLPLRANPAIVAILNLLELFLPRSDADPGPAFSRKGVVDAWRSPYFDWAKTQILPDHDEDGTITLADADALDTLARSGRVIGGLEQWEELFEVSNAVTESQYSTNGEESSPGGSSLLTDKFRGFQKLIDPGREHRSYREFALWLDTLLGPEPGSSLDDREPANILFLLLGDPSQSKEEAIFQRDLQALREFKEILRSMVWVDEKLELKQPVSYSHFYSELVGLIEAAAYVPPEWQGGDKILAADIIEARGLSFRAAAVLGMAEGEFPKTYVEDPFLWEADRSRLSQNEGLLLDSSIESYEREYFYEAITRPREKLLLTRPRLADSGAEWQASPFWEEIRRLFDVEPTLLTTESVPAPSMAASLPELIESLVIYTDHRPALDYVEWKKPGRMTRLLESSQHFDQRYSRLHTPHNGDLTSWATLFSDRFDSSYRWNPRSLESYHSCPYYFFVGRVLKLELRQEPAEGLDAAQSGTIYHKILEKLYQTLEPEHRTNPDKLLAILPMISRSVLDEAPAKEGFRETAWWRETRQEIANNVARSIIAMAEIQGDFVPVAFELNFSRSNNLEIWDGDDRIILGGIIDRVDQDHQGRTRIIDYKTAGPSNYTKQTLENGDKIQIALYSLAARDALDQGEPVDGFYWHVRHATASDLTLGSYGPSEAIDVAIEHAWNSVRGARQGYFVAHPPAGGCPSYCPAAGFCWNYRPGLWS